MAALSVPLSCFGRNHTLCAGNQPAITVHVFNDAYIDGETLRKAELDTRKIFDSAGVRAIVQTVSGKFPAHPVGSEDLIVRIVDRRPLHASQQMLGFVASDPVAHIRYAAAYVPAVDRMAKAFACDIHVVLGTVIAHEIGHLILGPSHAPKGIMHPQWDPLDFLLIKVNALEFTPAEAGRLRDDAREIDSYHERHSAEGSCP
jgi:hypothetical protein